MKERIKYGAKLICDVGSCKGEFISFSMQSLVRKQAVLQGWARVPGWRITEPGDEIDRTLADVCPEHAKEAMARTDTPAERRAKIREKEREAKKADAAARKKAREDARAIQATAKAAAKQERQEKREARERAREAKQAAKAAKRAHGAGAEAGAHA